jgi:uncharacterized membrane protein
MHKLSYLMMALLAMITTTVLAQDNKQYTADVMRSNGKIYVVVAVCLIILFGLIAYLVRIDRKISKLEKGAE